VVLTFTPEEHISMMLKLQRHIDQMDDVSTDDLLDAMKGVVQWKETISALLLLDDEEE